jgi:hypothetical protein
MYTVRHHSYTGLQAPPEAHHDHTRARDEIAARITRARRRGFPLVILERGQEWEIQEPDGCAGVPDACGTLALRHVTFECRECGCEHEERDDALQCCTENDYCGEDE